jgi:hypothetical protein
MKSAMYRPEYNGKGNACCHKIAHWKERYTYQSDNKNYAASFGIHQPTEKRAGNNGCQTEQRRSQSDLDYSFFNIFYDFIIAQKKHVGIIN